MEQPDRECPLKGECVYRLEDGKCENVKESSGNGDALCYNLESQLADKKMEIERLREINKLAKRLADYCRLEIEAKHLKEDSPIGIAYRDFMVILKGKK